MSNRAGAAGAPHPDERGSPAARWSPLLAALFLALAALCVYGGTFSYPFLLDDLTAIRANATIGSLAGSLHPPPHSPVSGRPLLNLSYALNYSLGGFDVRGYHAFNLLVHILGALAVLGIVRRTLAMPALGGRFSRDRLTLSFLVAALWLLHPLNTEAVTYVSERAESLMGLLYLATLYFFVLGAGSPRPAGWFALSVLACLLGALTKEVMATAPLIVFLYDRTFCAASVRAVWRTRWRYYLGLASSWLLLACLVPGTGPRGVGFGNGVGWWAYALTSCRSVVLYLKLALWPHPLVFDYGMAVARHPGEVALYALVLACLLAFSAAALRRWTATGFACAWFFVILAPTSSFVPLAYQPMAEHRVYLSLVAVVSAGVLALYSWLGIWCAAPLAALAVLLGWLSHERNRDYRTELSIWSDTAAKEPGNPRARVNLGAALAKIPGDEAGAVSEYRAALRIDPDYAEAHNDLGLVLAGSLGRIPEAVAQFEAAVRAQPDYLEAHDNLGMALAGMPGRLPEAISEYEAALRIDPGYAKAHNDLGIALAASPGRLRDGVEQFEEALRIRPDYAEARNNLETATQMMAPTGKAQ